MSRDRGQATVELALCLPMLCTLLLGIVQVAVVTRDRLAVQLAAREGARAAAIGADDGAVRRAVEAAVALAPLTVRIERRAGTARVTVGYRDPTDVPLVGAVLRDVVLQATVTMATEPP
ncbi:MAG: TadE family protein [Ilumatobacteraceae bacterium]